MVTTLPLPANSRMFCSVNRDYQSEVSVSRFNLNLKLTLSRFRNRFLMYPIQISLVSLVYDFLSGCPRPTQKVQYRSSRPEDREIATSSLNVPRLYRHTNLLPQDQSKNKFPVYQCRLALAHWLDRVLRTPHCITSLEARTDRVHETSTSRPV
jgi:hypothetical protein